MQNGFRREKALPFLMCFRNKENIAIYICINVRIYTYKYMCVYMYAFIFLPS